MVIHVCFHDRILDVYFVALGQTRPKFWTFAMVTLERVSGLSWQTLGQVAPPSTTTLDRVQQGTLVASRPFPPGAKLSFDRPMTDIFLWNLRGPRSRYLLQILDDRLVSTGLNSSLVGRRIRFTLLSLSFSSGLAIYTENDGTFL